MLKKMLDIYSGARRILIKPSKPSVPIDETDDEQEGEGLEILTPKQMITRLPILLAQLRAGNNSEQLKNEIRQLLCFLYASKT